eukprot:SAG31_NODE_4789_length_2955_cov_1.493347_6_plen_179_part_00
MIPRYLRFRSTIAVPSTNRQIYQNTTRITTPRLYRQVLLCSTWCRVYVLYYGIIDPPARNRVATCNLCVILRAPLADMAGATHASLGGPRSNYQQLPGVFGCPGTGRQVRQRRAVATETRSCPAAPTAPAAATEDKSWDRLGQLHGGQTSCEPAIVGLATCAKSFGTRPQQTYETFVS